MAVFASCFESNLGLRYVTVLHASGHQVVLLTHPMCDFHTSVCMMLNLGDTLPVSSAEQNRLLKDNSLKTIMQIICV